MKIVTNIKAWAQKSVQCDYKKGIGESFINQRDTAVLHKHSGASE